MCLRDPGANLKALEINTTGIVEAITSLGTALLLY